MKCEKCEFRNKPHASQCKICHTSLAKEYATQMKERSNFNHYIHTGDYQSCKKYLESCEKQGAAALSTSINQIYDLLPPIHAACQVNNTAIVELLFKYKADPNIVLPCSLEVSTISLGRKRSSNVTTMHLAADHGNLEVMKLLIENGFNLHQMNICMSGDITVFLILCKRGDIKCLDYIISLGDHGNQNNNNSNNPYIVDIFAEDHIGRNGLNLAVRNDDLEMCQYLLKHVYNEKGLRDRIINDDVFQAAATNTGTNCVSIFKCLVEYKQSIFGDMELSAKMLHFGLLFSWQIVAYMIENKEFHTKFPSKFVEEVEKLGDRVIFLGGSSKENYHKCMPPIWNFLSIRLGDRERLDYVAKSLVSYFKFFDFENDFHMFVDMLELMLSRDRIKDWNYFYKSTTVMPYEVCSKVDEILASKMKINGKWKDLVRNMMIAYNDPHEWHKMSKLYNYSDDKNDINIDKEFCHCTKHHVMVPFPLKKERDEMSKECISCNETKDNMGYWCNECNEYICCDCGDMFELNQLLLNKQFSLFEMKIKKYNKDSPLLKKV